MNSASVRITLVSAAATNLFAFIGNAVLVLSDRSVRCWADSLGSSHGLRNAWWISAVGLICAASPRISPQIFKLRSF